MEDIALESSAAMSSADWHSQHWMNTEHATIRRLAETAGWYAYAGPGWSNTAIRHEAQQFLRESLLLSPQQRNHTLQRLVEHRFHAGWRGHEQKEQQP